MAKKKVESEQPTVAVAEGGSENRQVSLPLKVTR